MTNERMAENTARRLADLMRQYGIEVEPYDATLRPIERVLRGSWYVDKVKQMGHTDCIHLGFKDCIGNFFIVVLEDGHLMTGANCMILDAVSCLTMSVPEGDVDVNDVFYNHFRWKGYGMDDDGVVVFELSQLRELMKYLKAN